MATALQNALKRKKELERELAEINRFIALYDQFSEPRAVVEAAPHDPTIRESRRGTIVNMADGVGKSGRVRPLEFADFMEAAIRNRGGPMTRTALVDALQASGIAIPSEDKPRYLGTILWRHRERFVNIAGLGY